MTEFAPDMEGIPMEQRLTLEVSHLTYSPSSAMYQSVMKSVSEVLPTNVYEQVKEFNKSV